MCFIVDSSGSIQYKGPENWNKTLAFVVDVINQFTIGPNDVQVAFVLFSDEATVEWGLTRYSNKAELVSAVRRMRYIGRTTNLNDALNKCCTQVLAQARSNAKKAGVILTDGEDNVPVVDTPLTIQNAAACKRAGVRLIAIGVSDDVNEDRLRQIASSPSDYHAVDDFDALPSVVAELQLSQICGTTTAPPVTPSRKICNIFYIDI